MAFDDQWAIKIREQMGKLGMTQAELGEYLGKSHQYGHRLWQGDFKKTPPRDLLREVEEVLQLEPWTLCVLAGYLPAGDNPKVERANGQIIVRLESRMVPVALFVAPIIHGPSRRTWVARPIDTRPPAKQAA